MTKINYYKYDLPNNVKFSTSVAIDTEAMGLKNYRDRLCTIQLCDGGEEVHLVHFPEPKFDSPNLKKLLSDKDILKIFHFARFDVGIMQHYLNIDIENIFCTKIASKLVRTYTDAHGLKTLCDELLGVKISKQERASDWGKEELTPEQQKYAANDVLHLHKLMEILSKKLHRENRIDLAEGCFKFIPTRSKLDVMGWCDDVISY